MLAYVSFPEDWSTESGIYHEDIKQLDSITLGVGDEVHVVKDAGAIAAKRTVIAYNKTQLAYAAYEYAPSAAQCLNFVLIEWIGKRFR